jgi:hypothetical protein
LLSIILIGTEFIDVNELNANVFKRLWVAESDIYQYKVILCIGGIIRLRN